MDDGIDDTSDLYNDSYQDDATGKNSARQGMNITMPQNKNSNREKAANNLRASEGSAAQTASSAAGGAAGAAGAAAAKAAEKVKNARDGLFTGQGKHQDQGKSSGKKFNMKKALPLLAIFLPLILGIGAISFIGQSFQLFNFGEQVKQRENTLSAAVYADVENDVSRRLESSDPADSLSTYMQELLAAFGFEYIENQNSDGTVARALVYQGNDDSHTLVAGAKVKDQILSTLSSTGSIIDNYREVASVPDGQDEIAAAWYGALSVVATAAWFDDSANLTYQRLGLNPGKFNTGNANPTDEEIIEMAKAGSISEDINATTGTTSYLVVQSYECGTEEEPKTCYYWDETSFDSLDTKITADDNLASVKQKLSNRAVLAAFSSDSSGTRGVNGFANKSNNQLLASNTSAKNSGASVADQKKNSSIASTIGGLIKNKTVNFANDILSAIDQTKAGVDGGGSAMNYFGNLLNTPAESYDIDGTTVVSNMAATASTSFNSWFSDSVSVDPNNPLVKKYNVAATLEGTGMEVEVIDNNKVSNYNNMENTSQNARITENMDNSDAQKNCQAIPNGVPYEDRQSLIETCPGEILDASYTIPDDVATYAYSITSIDLVSDPAGEEAAVALNEGISLWHDAMIKQSSGSYGDEQAVLDNYRMNQSYLAKLANYERYTKDPFDASSTNTFLGNIISNLLPFATALNNNSVYSTISATTKVFSNSISALLPKAAAASIDELGYITETTTECVATASSDMVCDIYGNPIAVMPTDYMASSRKEISDKMTEWGMAKSCDADGSNCELDNSNADVDYSYQQWLLCTQNDTTVNNNVSLETKAKGSGGQAGSIWDAIVSFFKGLIGIDSGEGRVRTQISCGGNYANQGNISIGGKSVSIDELYKTYAQFNLNQRVDALMGYTEGSASVAYLQDYYNEHPLDQSFEGIIARQSGLTLAEVKQAFSDIEYAVYIARYNPTERYQFVENATSDLNFALSQTDQDTMKTAAIVAKMQDFEELKNRSFAA